MVLVRMRCLLVAVHGHKIYSVIYCFVFVHVIVRLHSPEKLCNLTAPLPFFSFYITVPLVVWLSADLMTSPLSGDAIFLYLLHHSWVAHGYFTDFLPQSFHILLQSDVLKESVLQHGLQLLIDLQAQLLIFFILYFAQTVGALFGNLFWLQFEW